MIEAKTHIPTPAFQFAASTAQSWFLDVEAQDDTCVIHIGPADLQSQETRERLCSICGNTPGLADALVTSLDENQPVESDDYEIRLVIQRSDDAEIPHNHPGENAERVRRALP